MTFQQLEYFCAVCRYHSITRAANELFVSQPTVSVAIRNLETEFQTQFFRHGKNTIALTREGEEFYKKAEQLLSQSQELYDEFTGGNRVKNPVRIGIPPVLSTIFFPKLLEDFRAVSHVPVALYEHGSVEACERVDKKELDAALVNLDFYDLDRFNYRVMAEDRYVYCVSKDHPLAEEAAVTFESLRDEKIILFRTDSVQNRTIMARYAAQGITPDILLHASQLRTIENFLRTGDAGAFLYSMIPLDAEQFVKLPVEPPITSRMGLVWKKDAPVNSRTARFLEFAEGYELQTS